MSDRDRVLAYCNFCGNGCAPHSSGLCAGCATSGVETLTTMAMRDDRAHLSTVEGERDRYREALDGLTAAAEEMTSWDWQHLLIYGPDSDAARRDADVLEAKAKSARAALRVPGGQP